MPRLRELRDPLICAWFECGEEFTTSDKRRRFCSTACGQKGRDKSYGARKTEKMKKNPEQEAAYRKAYMAKWHEENPDYSRQYHEDNKEKRNAQRKKWGSENKDKIKQNRKKQKDKINAYRRESYKKKRDAEKSLKEKNECETKKNMKPIE